MRKTWIYSRRNGVRFVKEATVLRFVLISCVSSAIIALVLPEPSPTLKAIVSHIPRQPVESSAIAKIGYSKRRHILEIEFVNGAVYRYLNVPIDQRGIKSALLRFIYQAALPLRFSSVTEEETGR